MKALVAFYSKTGVTEGVAGLVADRLKVEGVEVAVTRIETVRPAGLFRGIIQARACARPAIVQPETDVGDYDLVFLGFPVWAGMPAPAVNSFLAGLKGAAGRKFALFATCGARGGHEAPLKVVSGGIAGSGGEVVASSGFWRAERRAFKLPVAEFVRQALEAAGSAR